MAIEALFFMGNELEQFFHTLIGADHETLASVNANPSKEIGSESLRSDRAIPLSADYSALVPSDKVDGVDGGIVDDEGNRYWVSGPGKYEYLYDANGNVIYKKWIPETEALKAFRLFA